MSNWSGVTIINLTNNPSILRLGGLSVSKIKK